MPGTSPCCSRRYGVNLAGSDPPHALAYELSRPTPFPGPLFSSHDAERSCACSAGVAHGSGGVVWVKKPWTLVAGGLFQMRLAARLHLPQSYYQSLKVLNDQVPSHGRPGLANLRTSYGEVKSAAVLGMSLRTSALRAYTGGAEPT